MGEPRITASVLKVLAGLLADPGAQRYGLELMQQSGLPSGTLYPILARLERAGWVESHWEQIDPVAEGRPSRRYYQLTPDGTVAARREVALMQQQMSRATGPAGRPQEA
ncbi:PadR family transcriptional regulator [Paractinoplanes brasiliensis]|uniref:PadR family transcriptional regulator n=1 Tax=Paractinoplanes brasiliensis TaxID=52695 RepID=A0A4R6K019_9ACTN|nr:PadR family transcriptional regulator [Actinoplanes brasiliensis]TDO42494.1 PadR family transcriptional regulator [Actinoplanes brasiliensis]GID31404.1 PadR family transcriptional regulator [Actinoplanes brasiliensis]